MSSNSEKEESRCIRRGTSGGPSRLTIFRCGFDGTEGLEHGVSVATVHGRRYDIRARPDLTMMPKFRGHELGKLVPLSQILSCDDD